MNEYIVLFDANNSSSSLDFVSLLLGIIVFFAFVYVIVRIKKKKKVVAFDIVRSGLLLIISCVFVFVPFLSKQSDDMLLEEYRNGHYSQCEGEVYNFQKYGEEGSERHETFCVDGVEFSFSYAEGVFYDQLSIDGGYIVENGQRVKVCYIEGDNKNYIMKLEMLKSDIPAR